MKNDKFKKGIIGILVLTIFFILIFSIICIVQYKNYTRNINITISSIINQIVNKYPDIPKSDIISILNNDNLDGTNLEEYGININTDSVILANENIWQVVFINVAILCLFSFFIILIFFKYKKSEQDKINEIINYIEQINNKEYSLDIQDNSEDELSILKNELYKITVMLKEESENSLKDKLEIKKSLEDISHQLKTPLTSINIILDNLMDNPNMDEKTRMEFMQDIHREIQNINFLIGTLLKLSKFDANVINFVRKEELLSNIINESIKNISAICDLKNVKIVIDEPEICKNVKIYCDYKWQVEAVTNILKNSVEHSKENSVVSIAYEGNNVYSQVIIKDNGIGIDQKEIKHIFERFYKGKNSSKDSIGIGLALAKTIVEKDNGYITVKSELNKGTEFCIKYLK